MADRDWRGWDCHVHVFEGAAPLRAGHYVPETRTLDEIERTAGAHGLERLVLVQPSVYGTDNSALLDALHRQPGRHRGVVVIDGHESVDALEAMHRAGVRGARFNLVSPVGNGTDTLSALAPGLRRLGWHAEWYATAMELPRLVDWQRETGLTFVLDHLAGLRADEPVAEGGWLALRRLAEAGAWLKLSGWYRLGSALPHEDIVPLVREAAALFADRLVWGSDWPHTSLAFTHESRHEALMLPLRRALGDSRAHDVLHRFPANLYS